MKNDGSQGTGAGRDQIVKGVWAAMPIPWRDDYSLDAGLLAELIYRYAESGIHGAYTTGTDGEGYEVEFDEFRPFVRTFLRLTRRYKLPAMIGCSWLNARGIEERIRCASDEGADGVILTLPQWFPLNDRELMTFFGDIGAKFPNVALIHHNTPLARRVLNGEDYAKILEVAPNLVGSKQDATDLRTFVNITTHAPGMLHFACDNDLMPYALFGAAGMFSALVHLNPRWMIEFWHDCATGSWEEATRKRRVLDEFGSLWEFGGEATSWVAISKAACRVGIMPEMPALIRPPYLGPPKADTDRLQGLLEGRFRELRYEAPARNPRRKRSG